MKKIYYNKKGKLFPFYILTLKTFTLRITSTLTTQKFTLELTRIIPTINPSAFFIINLFILFPSFISIYIFLILSNQKTVFTKYSNYKLESKNLTFYSFRE